MRLCERVHRRMLLMSSSLLLQQCEDIWFIQSGWSLRWVAGGRTPAVLWDVPSRISLIDNISTLNDGSLKLLDKFTYLESSISSTENDINMRLEKAWTAISWLLVIWKSELYDKIKHNFFQAVVVSILLYGCTN